MKNQPRLVILFDIDHTLIDYPLNRETVAGALDEATGVPGLLDQMDWQGSSDLWITEEAKRIADVDGEGLYERFAAAYTRILEESLASMPSIALPGSTAVLERLRDEHEAVLGIATGNTRHNARLKLEQAELAGFFDPLRGGFGDDLDDRAAIVRTGAVELGREPGDRLVVVGDTLRDVSAALASGAVAVGVATGERSVEELRAAGATVSLAGLADVEAAVAAIVGR